MKVQLLSQVRKAAEEEARAQEAGQSEHAGTQEVGNQEEVQEEHMAEAQNGSLSNQVRCEPTDVQSGLSQADMHMTTSRCSLSSQALGQACVHMGCKLHGKRKAKQHQMQHSHSALTAAAL